MKNNEYPLVCLVMPVYNGEKTIKYALASILRQTYDNWICIIVNDGSTDGTRQILDSISDSRFRIYHMEKNVGRGMARDKALELAEGKYLAYIDADDMMHKDKIGVQVKFLESNLDVRMVSCGCITFDKKFEALRICGVDSFKSTNIMRYGQALPLLLPAAMVRLDHAKIFRYNHHLNVGEDYDYFARYCEGYKYANIGMPYYYYQTGNVTAKKLLYYQCSSMKKIAIMWQMNLKAKAIESVMVRSVKLCIYAFLLIFVDANVLVNFRGGGKKISMEQRLHYEQERSEILSHD
jgi:glycosyltransferase involved in cell wall biosynthesis